MSQTDGIWAIKISPEAGTLKNRKPRTVRVHEHLIEQGFVEFAKASGEGPLFYSAPKRPKRKADASKGKAVAGNDPMVSSKSFERRRQRLSQAVVARDARD